MKIVSDIGIPYLDNAFGANAVLNRVPSDEITPALLKDADIVLTRTRTTSNAQLLKGSRVKFVGSATAGFDHLDTQYLEKQGIIWKNAPACNADSVEQYITTAIFEFLSSQKIKLNTVTVGVIGIGNIGSRVVNVLNKCGIKTLQYDPIRASKEQSFHQTELNHLLNQSDIVTLHVPLTKESEFPTLAMVDELFISELKKGALLINCSRGKVAKPSALKSIITNRDHHLILDVFPNEPAISPTILEGARFITPHIAGYATEGKADATHQLIKAIREYFPELINPDYAPELPIPKQSQKITINCKDKSIEEIAYSACSHAFQLENESETLRKNPEKFENLRNTYPCRRESKYYTVKLINGNAEVEKVISAIGFRIFNP